jgi:hypothetical protein
MNDTGKECGRFCGRQRAKGSIRALLVLLALTVAGTAQLHADAGDPSARVARLAYIQGTVSVQPSGVDQWSQAEANYPVATGDRIYADKNGRDELSIGGIVVRMSNATDLTMTNLTDQLTQLGLAQGTIRVRTFGLDPSQQVEVDTPNGAITVTQPGDIRVDSFEGDGGTQVTVNSGAVQVTGPNLSQNLAAGTSVRLMGTNPIQIQELAMPGLDPFDQWSVARDRHMEDSRSAQYVSRQTPGYDDLDDYGTWDAGTEYGPVWYPSQVAVDWVPYRTGHWVWTGPWGWTWVESEPWGYAPFHYGRWAYIRNRWGWVPGPVAVRPYWSPALVAFAGGGGFSVGVSFGGGGLAAWFPLGVGEPYVPWYHCSPRYVREVNVTNINITNIHNTTIINNYNTFVRNTNNYTNIQNANYQFVNRERGFTAVPGRAVVSGQQINRNLAQLRPEQIRSAQVIAHPSLQPTRQSVVTRPVVHAMPVSAQRPTLLTQGGRQAQAVAGARPQPVPYHALPVNSAHGAPVATRPTQLQQPNGHAPQPVNQPAQLQQQNVHAAQPVNRPAQGGTPTLAVAPRPNAPGEANAGARPLISRSGTTMPGRSATETAAHPELGARPSPAGAGQPANPASGARPGNPGGGYSAPATPVNSNRGTYNARPLVTHNEPPIQQPSLQQQQRGMQHDPGRPLDPQQRQDVQAGHRAAPSADQEYFPHAPQVQRPQQQMQTPQQQVRAAPQQQMQQPVQHMSQPQMQRAPQQQVQHMPQPQMERAPQQQAQHMSQPQMQRAPEQTRAPQPQRMPEQHAAPQSAPHNAGPAR